MQRISSVLFATAILLASGPARALDVCVEGAYPPFSQTEADGTLTGFDIDIAQALCAELGEPCTMVKTAWTDVIPSLLDGECDAIVASMSNTPERRARIDFTDRYYRTPLRFVGPDDAGPGDSPDDLAGKVVGLQGGTIFQSFMAAHYPGTRLRYYTNQEHVLLDLTLGRLDAVIGEQVQLDAGFLETRAGEGFAFFGARHYDPAILGEGAAIGVRKTDPELRENLNAAIAAIRADGTYETISGRYFDGDIYGE
jgi:polar amino acid transport system substrate-binding protein/arginine/ornithine transport system substrate-binding protein